MIKKFIENPKNRFNIYMILSIFYAMFIFYLSSKSNLGYPRSIFNFPDIELIRKVIHYLSNSDLNFLLLPFYIIYKQPDKLAHMILYSGFGFFLYYTIRNSSNPILSNQALLFAIIIGTLYGISDEFHQSFVPGRSSSIWDLVADSMGLIMAQIAIFIKDRLGIKYRNFFISNKQDTYK